MRRIASGGADRVRRVAVWTTTAAVAALPLLTTDPTFLTGPDAPIYGAAVLAGAALLGASEVPSVRDRLRMRFGAPAVRAGRAWVVWALIVAAAAIAVPGHGLLFLLAVPVALVATVAPLAGTGAVVLASLGAGVVIGLPDAGRSAVWAVTIVGVGAVAGAGLHRLSDETLRRGRAQADATRRAELLNVVATTSLGSHGLDADEVVAAVVNGALGLGLRAAVVFEPDLQAGVYRCREAAGLPPQITDGIHPLDDGDVVRRVVRSHRPVTAVAGDGDASIPEPLAAAGFRSLWAVPVFVEDEVAAVLSVLDERPRRPDEAELVTLRILADRLGDALAHTRRTTLQRRSIARLQEAERLKHDFVSTISHELRTPATVIKAANELLFTRWDQMSEETRRRLRAKIDEHADRLASLLDTLLIYRNLDDGRIRPDPRPAAVADVLELVRSEVESRHAARARDVRWEVDDVTVVADPGGIRRVVSLLVDNALTHTPWGTRVTVVARRSGRDARITVADDGPGIDPSQVPVIRQPFNREGDVLTRSTRGLGLGLTICELILQAHGRELHIDSAPDEGTRCSFELPIHRPRPTSPEGRVIELPDLEGSDDPDR